MALFRLITLKTTQSGYRKKIYICMLSNAEDFTDSTFPMFVAVIVLIVYMYIFFPYAQFLLYSIHNLELLSLTKVNTGGGILFAVLYSSQSGG